MLRVAKPEGFGNVILEEAPIPEIGPSEVLVRNKVSMISRGSEILRRYMRQEAIDPYMMGYSVAGVVERVGEEAARRFQPGDRVFVSAPHAQYVVAASSGPRGDYTVRLPANVDFERGSFLSLCIGAAWWAHISGIQPGDTVVVLGQGLVGNLVMQAARQYLHEKLIAVDVLDLRCRLAAELGAEVVIDGSRQDPVEEVKRLTGGEGADVVIDCVGGKAGVKSFTQAQDMVRVGGTIHLIGLYHGEPLLLDAGKIQRRKLIGGYYSKESAAVMTARATEMLRDGRFRVDPLITHRFPYTQAKEAYDLLYDRLNEAMGVLLIWD